MRRLIPLLLLTLVSTGCYRREFEPQKFEDISTNEFAFLVPLEGDTTQQSRMTNEAFYVANKVQTKRVKIPQVWVKTGYDAWAYDRGQFKDAMKVIKVDGAPVTREWTADPNSGTSNKNEAIWTMTSDQVKWSTGWAITASITSVEDAAKFLAKYPNGSLKEVLDREVRAKLQTVFGLKVTDLPMQELQKQSTPIIQATVKEVTDFFAERGITISNLGISGGYVYEDPSITQTMVKLFNAERGKDLKKADTDAQAEENKRLQMAAEAKAKAILTEREAEAKGIELVTAARKNELEAAKTDLDTYLALKRIEVDLKQAERWDGALPKTIFGGAGGVPLISVPADAGK